MALLRMVAPGTGYRGDTQNGILRCNLYHVTLPRAVTDLGENFAKKKGLHHKLVEFSAGNLVKMWKFWYYGFPAWNGVTPKWWHPGRAAPLSPSDATGLEEGYCKFSMAIQKSFKDKFRSNR